MNTIFRYYLLEFFPNYFGFTFSVFPFIANFFWLSLNSLVDIILGCDYNDNYSHSTGNLDSSKYYGIDVNLCKATNFLNPTYNSKINLCINDDYISIVNNESNNNRNPSGFRHKRESNFLSDENMNHATPLINNALASKNCRKTLNSPPAGKLNCE